MSKSLLFVFALSLVAIGCSGTHGDCLTGEDCALTGVDPVDPGEQPPAPLCADTGADYIGLGDVSLIAGRTPGLINANRGRTKPYSSLVTEYSRVLGESSSPELIKETGTAFGAAPERWFSEPQPSAVSLYTAFRVGFEACLKTTGGLPVETTTPPPAGTTPFVPNAKFKIAPTDADARSQCASWARTFWSRDASAEEIQACVDVALSSTSEMIPDDGVLTTRTTTPERRWAYTCATLLTATGFLVY